MSGPTTTKLPEQQPNAIPPWLQWTWVVPAIFLVGFLLVPLTVLATKIIDPQTLPYFADPRPWRVAGLAATQATISTGLAVILGIPMANILTRYRFPGRSWALAVATVPFVLPTVVVALAFRVMLSGSIGTGFTAVVLAHAYLNLAVVVRIVGARWATIDPRLQTVARTLGASTLNAFRSVTIPQLRSAIAAASAIVFVFSFTSLGVVLFLGDSSTRTLETLVLRQASVLLDFRAAAASAGIQAVLVAGILLWAASQRSFQRGGATRTFRRQSLNRANRFPVTALAIVAVGVSIIPLIYLVIASVRTSTNWTLDFWRIASGWKPLDAGSTRIGSPGTAISRSVVYAAATGLIAAVVGGFAAVSVLRGKLGRAVAIATSLPLGISAATLGLGTLLAYGRPPVDLRASGLLIPIAHALIAVPLVVAVATPTLRSTDSRLTQVAATLGARPSRAWLTGYGPVLRTVMVAAGGLAFAVSLGEFGAASMLARADGLTVPLLIARLISRPGEASLGTAAALATILAVITTVLVAAIDRSGRRS